MQEKSDFCTFLPAFLEQTVKKLCQILLAASAYMTIYQLAVVEEQHRRDIHDAVLLARVGVVIDIKFADHYAAFVFVGQLFQNGQHHFARTAPTGPKIYY
jgi:hypothetical protein